MRQTRPASNRAVVSRIGTPPGAFDLTIYTIVGSHDVPFQFHMLLTVSCKKTRYGIVASGSTVPIQPIVPVIQPILPTNHPSFGWFHVPYANHGAEICTKSPSFVGFYIPAPCFAGVFSVSNPPTSRPWSPWNWRPRTWGPSIRTSVERWAPVGTVAATAPALALGMNRWSLQLKVVLT